MLNNAPRLFAAASVTLGKARRHATVYQLNRTTSNEVRRCALQSPSPSPRLRDWLMAAAVLTLTITGVGGKVQAGLVININQVGSDVVMTGSGTINLADLTYNSTGPNSNGVIADIGAVVMGTSGNVDTYTSITGPTSFGPGGSFDASSGTGPVFGPYGTLGLLEVPQGYTSGTSLSATDTYSGATFSSLGLTPGTYTWTWGTGANADFLTVNIGTASVPEPTSLMMLGTGTLTMLGYARRRRRASA